MSTFKRNAQERADTAGFTLIEMMIAIFVSLLVMASVVSVYIAQSKSHSVQDDVANIQQNLRGALVIMQKEIRLAGCDPTQSHLAGFLIATGTELQFTRDIKGNGAYPNLANGSVTDPDENITYQFLNNQLWRTSNALPGQPQSIANNIDKLEFDYILADGTIVGTPPNLSLIRGVQVYILAKTANPSSDLMAPVTYTTSINTNWTTPNDYYRRRFVTITIECRNMWYQL